MNAPAACCRGASGQNLSGRRQRGGRGRDPRYPPASALLAVAPSAPRICEGSAPRRDESPLVALRMEGELQDAVGVVVVDLAVGDGLKDRVVALPSGANHVYARCVQSVP